MGIQTRNKDVLLPHIVSLILYSFEWKPSGSISSGIVMPKGLYVLILLV